MSNYLLFFENDMSMSTLQLNSTWILYVCFNFIYYLIETVSFFSGVRIKQQSWVYLSGRFSFSCVLYFIHLLMLQQYGVDSLILPFCQVKTILVLTIADPIWLCLENNSKIKKKFTAHMTTAPSYIKQYHLWKFSL